MNTKEHNHVKEPRIGGLLWIPAVIISIALIKSILQFLANLSLFLEEGFPLFPLSISLAFLILVSISLYHFFNYQKATIKWMIYLFGGGYYLSALFLIFIEEDEEAFYGGIIILIIAVLWTLYFLKSKRVKNTFIKDGDKIIKETKKKIKQKRIIKDSSEDLNNTDSIDDMIEDFSEMLLTLLFDNSKDLTNELEKINPSRPNSAEIMFFIYWTIIFHLNLMFHENEKKKNYINKILDKFTDKYTTLIVSSFQDIEIHGFTEILIRRLNTYNKTIREDLDLQTKGKSSWLYMYTISALNNNLYSEDKDIEELSEILLKGFSLDVNYNLKLSNLVNLTLVSRKNLKKAIDLTFNDYNIK